MSPLDPLEILQLVGYSVGALLPLWMAIQLVSHRSKLTSLERMLALLALTMGGWHTSNLVITLHSLFNLGYDHWTTVLRIADTVSVVSITFAYSFTSRSLDLWANAHSRPLTRVGNSGSTSLTCRQFSWRSQSALKGEYAPMFVVEVLRDPLCFWIAYVLGLIAVTEIPLLARPQIAVNAGS